VVELGELRDALARRTEDVTRSLLAALGYEPVGLRVPAAALPDFGLEPGSNLRLEIAARHCGFHVLRVRLAGELCPEAIQRAARSLYRHNPARRALLVFEAASDTRLVLASWGLGPGRFRLRKLWVDTDEPSLAELDILAGLAVDGCRTATDLALAHARALDREEVTHRFFREFRQRRADLAAALSGVPADATEDRLELALILLTRLLFLYFVQKKGWLGGDKSYVKHLYQAALRERVPFYRRRLKPLFFGALNRPRDRRGRPAAALGELPYLNGGLFERHRLERAHRRMDVPDEAFAPIFHDLLDKYQFTLRQDSATDADAAIDPEMLGKVFEGLMSGSLRGATGAFFTPRDLVEDLVDDALTAHLAAACGCDVDMIRRALEEGDPACDAPTRAALAARARILRILDPAVGSGAFLLAALQRLEALRDALEGRPTDPLGRFRRREEIIRRNLHGVDVNGAAVHLCELRLWLALIVDLSVEDVAAVPPLPNLDINIRQGDALLDPIDFLARFTDRDGDVLAGRWQRQMRHLNERRERYFHASGSGKSRVERGLRNAERELALAFLGELLARIDARRSDLSAAAASRDLFGKRSGLSRRQRKSAAVLKRRRREIQALVRKIRDAKEVPFFSFPVHFGDAECGGANFHVIVGNPPWVRTHRWGGLSRRRLKERYRFLEQAGWRTGTRLAGAGRGFGAQLDLSALFLERSLELLSEGGVVEFLLPAKLARGLSGAALRRRLVTSTRILRLQDLSSATERAFDATNYPLVLLAASAEPEPKEQTEVRCHDRHGDILEFRLPQSQLPLLDDDPAAPWALAPPDVRAAMARMGEAGPPLGYQRDRRPQRGLFTGNNALFVAEAPVPDSASDLIHVRIGGGSECLEASRLRPALRGEDLAPWRYETPRVLLWTHDDAGPVLAAPPPATAAYLRKHRRALRARVDLKPGQPYWALFRARPRKWGLRVAWRDIAAEPAAVVVPPTVEFLGRAVPAISLNTVYQIATTSDEEAYLLAAVLNSTVARAYLKAIAERASGGYFRFLGWTVALLPFPAAPDAEVRSHCIAISHAAHAMRHLDEADQALLDCEVGRLYGLTRAQLKALADFDSRFTNREDGP
jgi:hypothetical protein